MSNSATGKVVDLEGKGIAGLNIDIEDVSQVHDGRVLNDKPFVTDDIGDFTFTFPAYDFDTSQPGAQGRKMRLTVRLGRLVLKQVTSDEGALTGPLTFDKIVLVRKDVESKRVTLGTGEETRTSEGNAIRWLADNVDGWSRAAQVVKNASTLDIMQLEIVVKDFSDAGPTKEQPAIVLDFDSTDKVSGNEFVVSTKDDRIERAVLEAAAKHVDVRIQIPTMSIDGRLAKIIGIGSIIVISAILFFLIEFVLAVMLAVFLTIFVASAPAGFRDFYRKKFEEPELKKWFEEAALSGIDMSPVKVRELKHRSFNITHAKVVIDRGKEAVLLGSPFEQVYFDAPDHLISSGRRGASASKGPIHDVSVSVRGPALKDFQGLFNSHWKFTEPAETLPDPTTPGKISSPDAGEFLTTVQLALTLDRMFNGPDETDGEKGILEAYLRAIHFAKRFIYIENQYFHNSTVIQALIDELTAKPNLVAILLLNIGPDMPFYLRWQRRGLARIVDALTAKYGKTNVQKHFRVFSSFSHTAGAAGQKPRLLDNYLHTKTAIVDNIWATVGSANLDGASIDSEDYFRSALDGDVRHTEANVVVCEDDLGPSAAVDALRRRLWAEHLGILVNNQPGVLDVQSTELDDSATKNWLTVWSQKADAKLNLLKSDPNQVSLIHVLPVDFDYGPDTDRTRFTTFIHNLTDAFKDHYGLESYLNHTFSQDSPPKRKASDFNLDPPPDFPFTYGG
jgi:phosphatidylserine/phosphatidylglycerophosphate/cardiolipin synthase-like enzyme